MFNPDKINQCLRTFKALSTIYVICLTVMVIVIAATTGAVYVVPML